MTDPMLPETELDTGSVVVGGSAAFNRETSSQTIGEPAGIATTPKPPYFAVVFTSERTGIDAGYQEMAARMVELAARQPGFLGVESARDGELGITVSYWSSVEAIARWKRHAEHREAQTGGRAKWYRRYRVRITRVEKDYGFGEGPDEI